MRHFQTDQTVWPNSSAMPAGAMWAPLLGRTADIHGTRRILVVTMLVTLAGSPGGTAVGAGRGTPNVRPGGERAGGERVWSRLTP